MKRIALAAAKLVGVLVGVSLVWLFAGVLWPVEMPEPGNPGRSILLTNVSIVDLNEGKVVSDQSILVRDGEIEAIGTELRVEPTSVVDAGGRFALPGLFDMHVHSIKMSPWLTHPLFVAAGVTAVRDMGGCIGIEDAWVACAKEKRAWNESVIRGLMVGPRYDHVTSLAINGGPEIPDAVDRDLGVPTAQSAELRAAHDRARGIDFLKPYTMLPRDAYIALADAADRNGLYLAGHQPLAVSGTEAIEAGQRSIEHAFLFIWECFPGMVDLRTSGDPRSVYTDVLRRQMIDEHDPQLCSDLHTKMRNAGTAYVPTHTTRKLDAYAIDEAYRSDSRLKFVPSPLRTLWLQDANSMAERAGAGGQESYRDFYEFGIAQTGIAHAAGVTILAGTDAPDSFAFPGSGLHDELEHLVRAGLSPLDALRAATTKPAEFLGLKGQAGTIAVGARADIVLLSENPLVAISAVRSVDTVILAGVVYERPALDEMLATVEANAGHWSMWPKFLWQISRSPIMLKQFAD